MFFALKRKKGVPKIKMICFTVSKIIGICAEKNPSLSRMQLNVWFPGQINNICQIYASAVTAGLGFYADIQIILFIIQKSKHFWDSTRIILPKKIFD